MPLARIPSVLIPSSRMPLSAAAAAARRWSTSSQTHARRNAMVALTSLAQRRAEREDADAYLEAATQRRTEPAIAQPRRSAESS